MAATAGRTGDYFNIFGTVPVAIDTLTGDAAYPAGGYPVTGALWGLASGSSAVNNGIRGITTIGRNTAALLYSLEFNSQTGTVQFVTAGAEVAAGTNVSGITFNVLVFATGE